MTLVVISGGDDPLTSMSWIASQCRSPDSIILAKPSGGAATRDQFPRAFSRMVTVLAIAEQTCYGVSAAPTLRWGYIACQSSCCWKTGWIPMSLPRVTRTLA